MFSKQYTSTKIIVYSLCLAVCYLFQSVPALRLQFMGNAPELILVLCICVAFHESETFSAFFGLAAGLLCDTVTDSVVGASAIFFMFMAFAISVLLQTLLRNFFLTYIFMSLSVILVYLLLEYGFNCIFFGGIPFGKALITVILPKLLFTGLFCFPLYFIISFLSGKLWPGGEQY